MSKLRYFWKPSSQPVKTKGAPKKVKPTLSDNPMMRSPLYFKNDGKLFPKSPTSKSQKVFLKKLALANHLLHCLHQKLHSSMRCRFLCTNKLNESSMLRLTVTIVFELFLLFSVKEKRIIHLSANNWSKSWRSIIKCTHDYVFSWDVSSYSKCVWKSVYGSYKIQFHINIFEI